MVHRQIGYNIWLGGRTKKDQKVSVDEWMPLSSDKKENKPNYKPTEEEYKRIMNRLKIRK